ncbi:MAG: hypothetical protein WCI77_07780 [Candidatus Omnitrophota bacterium]
MIFDTFLFFNEIDLLKIRLEELKNKVDKFVVVEATRTFAFREKPLYFQEYKHEFKEYLDRIVYYLIDDTPPIKLYNRWSIDRYQRDCISKALVRCGCHDNDVILISDADEIPRASKISEAEKLLQDHDFVVFDQKFYVYYLNYIHRDYFCGTVACKYGTLKKLPSIDAVRWGRGAARGLSIEQRAGVVKKYADTRYPHISDGGWHFTSFGGPDSTLYKVQNFAHKELDKSALKGLPYIRHTIGRSNLQNSRVLAQKYRKLQAQTYPHYRDFVEIPLSSDKDFPVDDDLPDYLKSNKEKYKHFFKFIEPYCDSEADIKYFGTLQTIKMWLLEAPMSLVYFFAKILRNAFPKAYAALRNSRDVHARRGKKSPPC